MLFGVPYSVMEIVVILISVICYLDQIVSLQDCPNSSLHIKQDLNSSLAAVFISGLYTAMEIDSKDCGFISTTYIMATVPTKPIR